MAIEEFDTEEEMEDRFNEDEDLNREYIDMKESVTGFKRELEYAADSLLDAQSNYDNAVIEMNEFAEEHKDILL